MIRTGRDRGSGLLGSQPQPVIPASVIPEELISQVHELETACCQKPGELLIACEQECVVIVVHFLQGVMTYN